MGFTPFILLSCNSTMQHLFYFAHRCVFSAIAVFLCLSLFKKSKSKTGKSDRTCSGICTRRKDYFIFSSHDSFIYSSNTRKIRLNSHYFEPKNTILNEELSRIARNTKAPAVRFMYQEKTISYPYMPICSTSRNEQYRSAKPVVFIRCIRYSATTVQPSGLPLAPLTSQVAFLFLTNVPVGETP